MMYLVEDETLMNKGIRYKAREATNAIVTVFHAADASPQDIYREQRGRCMFDMGVHYLVMPDGTVYSCVPVEAHADIVYEHSEDGVYVMCVGAGSLDEMTDSQRRAYDEMMAALDDEYDAERLVED